MSTISENLQTIKNSTLAMKQAIIDKGGTINGDITTWDNSINNIPYGGSGGSSFGKKDVTFYDYDGTVLYAYTKDEFLSLSDLPPLPNQPGLLCQEWNYDYDNAIDYVTKYGKLDIGATYITDDGKTRLYIRIAAKNRMTITLYFSQTVDNGVIIDWGDGSDSQTISGTGYKNTSHTYASIGDYCITLLVRSGRVVLGQGEYYSIFSSTDFTSYNDRRLKKVEIGSNTGLTNRTFYRQYSLSSITIPNGTMSNIGFQLFSECYSLNSVIIPKSTTSFTSEGSFKDCRCLSLVILPEGINNFPDSAFYNCSVLSSIIIPDSVKYINRSAFYNCNSLTSVMIPDSSIDVRDNVFYNCSCMAYYDFSTHTSVPTLSGTNAFSSIPSYCKIIVPDNLYDTWIAATNWSTYASKIIKKSDWDSL